jgi:hypothetical protein
MAKYLKPRCDYCGMALEHKHILTLQDGYTVVDCPKFPKNEASKIIRSRLYRWGGAGEVFNQIPGG